MEKEYFKDRPDERTKVSIIKPGIYVIICLKDAQKYAKKLEHLTYGKVKKVLTHHDHPRGIKVMLESGEVGRVTYIIKDGLIVTNPKIEIAQDVAEYNRKVLEKRSFEERLSLEILKQLNEEISLEACKEVVRVTLSKIKVSDYAKVTDSQLVLCASKIVKSINIEKLREIFGR